MESLHDARNNLTIESFSELVQVSYFAIDGMCCKNLFFQALNSNGVVLFDPRNRKEGPPDEEKIENLYELLVQEEPQHGIVNYICILKPYFHFLFYICYRDVFV